MVNAWEVLLKAKILKDNNNKLISIYVIDKDKTKADGTPYKSPKYKTNRAGNFLTIEITKAIKALPVRYSTATDALPVTVDSEEKFINKYKWTFRDHLIPHLRERYEDLKLDTQFRKIIVELEKDINYCGVRYLDFNNKKGTKKKFYDPNIVTEFDKHYTKKT